MNAVAATCIDITHGVQLHPIRDTSINVSEDPTIQENVRLRIDIEGIAEESLAE